MKKNEHRVARVVPASIAEELGIEAGDVLVAINDRPIKDIFDYQYLAEDEYVEVLIRKPDGEEWLLEIDKEADEDLGMEFEQGLMDEYRTCTNKCIFCFIDQMPPGMRETLYFKDDDSRLSFLQGNYITLTNMSEDDVERIIQYHLAPINISFQTTNPELRKMMLHNRFAADALKKVDRFYEAGIEMNGQIVLCKGINDGTELERSIRDLYGYLPHLRSVSVVPVGLSKFREGLYPLEPFTAEEAKQVITLIEKWQKKAEEEFGLHFVHASDEWYLLAGRELPEQERYDGYLQLDNGVGMLRLFKNEFEEAYKKLMELKKNGPLCKKEELAVLTGRLSYPVIKEMAQRIMEQVEGLTIHVHAIRNDYFGERITVSGLMTGTDIIAQGKELPLGTRVLLPENVLRSGETVLLDDYTLADLETALQVPIDIVKSSGYDFLEKVMKK
ncbi:MAG: DUF512 domain-containing protein [Lachnospiraceae bacterium]